MSEELVRVTVIEAKYTNLHMKYRGRKLTVRRANEMALTSNLVSFVKAHGAKMLKKQYGFSRLVGPTYFYNVVYTFFMTPQQIIGLLDVNPRNKNSKTYQRIMSFLR